jgi:hypothetical protein
MIGRALILLAASVPDPSFVGAKNESEFIREMYDREMIG